MVVSMLLVKFGGSVITDKERYDTLDDPVLQRLAGELSNGLRQSGNGKETEKCILIHGAGSFGHILAKKYAIQRGRDDSVIGQLGALAKVQRDVRTLNLHVISALIARDMPAVSLPPSAFLRNRNGTLEGSPGSMAVFDHYLEMNAVPVSFGDVVPDTATLFSIVSGDTILEVLSGREDVDRAVFVMDVDGICPMDPRRNPGIPPIPVMKNAPTFEKFLAVNDIVDTSGSMVDVTGGIRKKLGAAYEISRNGVEVTLLNGQVPGRLESWLKGESVPTTIIERCHS